MRKGKDRARSDEVLRAREAVMAVVKEAEGMTIHEIEAALRDRGFKFEGHQLPNLLHRMRLWGEISSVGRGNAGGRYHLAELGTDRLAASLAKACSRAGALGPEFLAGITSRLQAGEVLSVASLARDYGVTRAKMASYLQELVRTGVIHLNRKGLGLGPENPLRDAGDLREFVLSYLSGDTRQREDILAAGAEEGFTEGQVLWALSQLARERKVARVGRGLYKRIA